MRLSDRDYWARRAQLDVVSYGKLRLFAANPRAFRLSKVRERSDAMVRGSILDCLVFEPHRFHERFGFRTVETKGGKVTLQSNAQKEEFATIEASGRTPILKEWASTAYNQLVALFGNTETLPAPWSALVTSGADQADYLHELQRFVLDPTAPPPEAQVLCGEGQPGIARRVADLGLTFVAKPDFAPTSGPFADALVDLKLTSECSFRAWSRKVETLCYHWQAGSYLDLWNAENPNDQRERFVWLVVDVDAPHDSGIVECGYQSLQTGREEYQEAMRRYAECLRNNHWPSPFHTGTELPVTVELPRWHKALSNSYLLGEE